MHSTKNSVLVLLISYTSLVNNYFYGNSECISVQEYQPFQHSPVSWLLPNKNWKDLCKSIISTWQAHLQEKAMAPHSSILAWKIPWTEEPGGLQSMGSLRVGDTTEATQQQQRAIYSLHLVSPSYLNELKFFCLKVTFIKCLDVGNSGKCCVHALCLACTVNSGCRSQELQKSLD